MSQHEHDWYATAESLIGRAQELPEREREGFLIRACDGNEALCREVTWLREILGQTNDNLFGDRGLALILADEENLRGQLPESFEMLRLLSRSRCSDIFLARTPGSNGPDNVVLMLLHRQSTGRRELGKLYNSTKLRSAQFSYPRKPLVTQGRTSDGRTFLVVAISAGKSLQAHCEQSKLSVRQRLVLFVKICSVVQQAHRRLAIHGDIRPANIIVTPTGEAELLFHGIAHFLTGKRTGRRDLFSSKSMPSAIYASPEQIKGQALSTATDIYSLGILLVHLLTGVEPWARSNETSEAIWLFNGRPYIGEEIAYRGWAKKTSNAVRRILGLSHSAGIAVRQDHLAILNVAKKMLQRRPRDRLLTIESAIAALGAAGVFTGDAPSFSRDRHSS